MEVFAAPFGLGIPNTNPPHCRAAAERSKLSIQRALFPLSYLAPNRTKFSRLEVITPENLGFRERMSYYWIV
jgi:hypothetical protein